MGNIAPLNTTFMASSMIGFLVSVLYVPKFSVTWAFSFGLIFVLMFIASLISMVGGTPDDQLSLRPRRVK